MNITKITFTVLIKDKDFIDNCLKSMNLDYEINLSELLKEKKFNVLEVQRSLIPKKDGMCRTVATVLGDSEVTLIER